MADHHHHHHQPQPTDDDDDYLLAKALAAAAYPRKKIEEEIAVYDEIMAGLAAAPSVRAEFVRLLSEYGEHDGAGDPCALRSSAAALLRGHPDVLRSFVGEIDAAVVVPVPAARVSPPAEERQGLAAALTTTLTTRRRRSDRRRRRRSETRADTVTNQQRMQIPAAAAKHGAAADEEVRLGEALAFFKRVHETAGPVVHGRILALLLEVEAKGSGSDGMDAEEVYARAKQVFGRAHVALLHAFATLWLPGAAEWKLQQQQQVAAQSSSHAAAVHHPRKKKAPAAGDDGNDGHVNVIAVLEVRNVNKKKRRRSVDDERLRAGESESSGGGGDNKKPPPAPPRRRRAAKGSTSAGTAAAGPERDEEVRRFRREWEFQTWYAKLVATSDRVTELLLRCTPHGVVGGGGGNRSPSSSSTMEALFPQRECREFLASCYGDRWGEMRAALLERDGGGESRVRALEEVGRSLRRKEEEAVVEECRKRRRHDPGRVAERLHGLAVGTAVDEERRRHHGGGRCMMNGGTRGMVMAGQQWP